MATLDTLSESAQVLLRTGATLSFPFEEEQISTSPIAGALILTGFGTALVNNLLGAREGSLQVAATWFGPNAASGDVFFNQSLDLAPFGTERNLTMDAVNPQIPSSLVTDSAQNPSLTYLDPTLNRALFLGSQDQGATFGSPVEIPRSMASHTGVRSSLDVDEQGVFHVAQEEGNLGVIDPVSQISYTQSQDGGATWDPPVVLNPPVAMASQFTPFIRTSPNGNEIHICYVVRAPMNFGPGDIAYINSSDGGLTFGSPIPIAVTNPAFGCQVHLGNNGEVYVIYGEQIAGVSEIRIRRSTDGGQSFTSAVTVNSSSTGNTSSVPHASVDSLGRIDVVWPAGTSFNQIRYARSSDAGVNFSAEETIVDEPGSGFVVPTGLVHDQSGRLHMSYYSDQDDPMMNAQIYYLLGE